MRLNTASSSRAFDFPFRDPVTWTRVDVDDGAGEGRVIVEATAVEDALDDGKMNISTSSSVFTEMSASWKESIDRVRACRPEGPAARGSGVFAFTKPGGGCLYFLSLMSYACARSLVFVLRMSVELQMSMSRDSDASALRRLPCVAFQRPTSCSCAGSLSQVTLVPSLRFQFSHLFWKNERRYLEV